MTKLSGYQEQPDGSWIGPDECHYDDLESVIQIGMLRFCGCGQPENALAHVLGGLELIADKPPADREAFQVWWDGMEKRRAAHFGSRGAEYFFYYWCDREELTEHGGSVPGWLTPKGQGLLDALRTWGAPTAPAVPAAK